MKKLFLFLFVVATLQKTFAQCQLSFSFNPNDTICLAQPTAISITNPGITGTITWSGGDLVGTQSGTTINVAPTSTQSYFVNWNNGVCNVTDTVVLTVVPVSALFISKSDPTCGKSNGGITAAGSGSSVVFTFFKDGLFYNSGNSILSNVPPGNYTFAVYDKITGCSDTVYNIVLTDNSVFPSFSNIQTTGVKCFGDLNGNIQVTVTGGTGNYTYAWSQDAANKTSSANNLTSGTAYTVTVNDGGCLPIDTTITLSGPSDSLRINVITAPDNCQQGNGKAFANTTGGTQPYQYTWSNSPVIIDSVTGILGPTSVAVTVTDQNGCTASTGDTILNTGSPSFKVFKVDSSCLTGAEGSIEIKPLSSDGPFKYDWSHDATVHTNKAIKLSPGQYTVSAYNAFNCAQIINVTVPAYNGSKLDLGLDQTIFLGQTTLIDVKTDAAIQSIDWSPATVATNNEGLNYATPKVSTTYTAIVKFGNGCTLTDNITIYIDSTPNKLDAPNIFTPNNDGINDDFYVKHKGIETLRVLIYDRWGAKVYEATDVDFRWNGTNIVSNNAEADGNYAYVIEYTTVSDSSKKIKQGFVTLVK